MISRGILIPSLCVTLALPLAAEKLNDGLERTVIASNPMVVNPVDVTVDVDGTVYTVETIRRKTADLDIREFRNWIPDTLSHRSVEERLAFYQKALPTSSVKDHNKDGKRDVLDLTMHSEKIHRFVDKDGDGMLDETSVFAEGFNSPVTGVAAGVFAWRGDVYATIVPDLWKLRDNTGDGMADKREALLTGFGIHIAYAGHDMHGIQLGPDGKLYWTIGDKAANVLSKEGKRWLNPYQGLLMRCNTDGTGYEVVAHGLRNVQQIAFDDFGNIFGVDNDADFPGEKERFIHIAEQSDAGWRMHYQYRGDRYNPWMRESISTPTGAHQPAHIVPAICHYEDGPAGFARDPGTALNSRYRGYFFMSGFPKKKLYAFKTASNGASFVMEDSHLVDQGRDFIGLTFGPDGALYLADWSGGYELNDKGAILKIDDPSQAGNPLRREVAAMLRSGPQNATHADLVARLEHPDQRVRTDAHLELASRKGGTALLAEAALRLREKPIACTHALWGLTKARYFSESLLGNLMGADSEHTRAQAAKWAGETAGKPLPHLISLLDDQSAVVRYHTAIAIGRLGMSGAVNGILAMLEQNANRDPLIRHAGVLALSGVSDEAPIKALRHPSSAVRLAAAVVCRRSGSANVAFLLDDTDPEVVDEAARAIHDDSGIQFARQALARLLEKNPGANNPAILRSIAANRAFADEASALRLTHFAANADNPEEGRIAALSALASWPVAFDLDLVDGRWNPNPAADKVIAAKAFSPVAALLQKDPNARVSKAAAETAKALGIHADVATLVKTAMNPESNDESRLQALTSLHAASPKEFKTTASSFLQLDSSMLRANAAKLLVDLDPALVIAYASRAAEKSEDTRERQQAIRLLADFGKEKAADVLTKLFDAAEAAPEIQLELLEAADVLPALKDSAASLKQSLSAKGDTGPYLASLNGGDANAGKLVFESHLAAQCTACHRIGDEGSNVGPPLKGIGKRGRAYLLEALVLPQKSIAPGFGIMTITRKDGQILTGAPLRETPDSITLRLLSGEESAIKRVDIDTKTDAISSMPPMGAILTPRELRDLVEYLTKI
jgi:putative membrane-bound dehydrogenase-like protein